MELLCLPGASSVGLSFQPNATSILGTMGGDAVQQYALNMSHNYGFVPFWFPLTDHHASQALVEKPSPKDSTAYSADDLVEVIDAPASLATASKTQTSSSESLKHTKEPEPLHADVPFEQCKDRRSKIFYILNQMTNAQEDKTTLASTADVIEKARKIWHFYPSRREVLAARKRYIYLHPEVIDGEARQPLLSHSHSEPECTDTGRDEEAKGSALKKVSIKCGAFKVTVEGSLLCSDLQRLLSTVKTALKDSL